VPAGRKNVGAGPKSLIRERYFEVYMSSASLRRLLEGPSHHRKRCLMTVFGSQKGWKKGWRRWLLRKRHTGRSTLPRPGEVVPPCRSTDTNCEACWAEETQISLQRDSGSSVDVERGRKWSAACAQFKISRLENAREMVLRGVFSAENSNTASRRTRELHSHLCAEQVLNDAC